MKLVLIALAALVLASPSHAQSFNCRYARQADEVRICRDPTLSNLDERLSRRFFRLRDALSERELVRLERSQARWLSERGECGSDGACIEDAYRGRLRELADW